MMMAPLERPRRQNVMIHSSHPSRMSNSRLHRFSLPDLSWGSQRMLRCFRDPDSDPSRIGTLRPSGLSDHAEFGQPPPVGRKAVQEEEEEDLKALRARLMVHYDVAVEKIEKAVTRDEKKATPVAVRQWNLRTRRAACNAPEENGGRKNSVSAGGSNAATDRKTSFSLELRREEIEEDFWKMFGEKPARRPKKRPRKIQNELDMLLPGMNLPYISADTYKVPEGKKR